MIVGIDLGTTYSLVCALQDGRPCVLANSLGETLTPSAVSLLDDGRWVVGAAARARLVTHPEATAAVFKRDMGTSRTYSIGGREFTPQALSAMVLRSLKEDTEAALGQPVERAVITVPAYFGELQRSATREAGQIAGFKVERLVHEPTAAALAYGLHAADREQRVVVLDLGGGTFDVTVLEIIEGVMEVQASAGDARLGGEDFLEVLTELVRERLVRERGVDLRTDRRAWSLMRELCESAKHRLSSMEVVQVAHPELRVGRERVALSEEITLVTAEQAWQGLLERLRRVIVRALRDARIDPSQVDEVLLVGGATRMPCVRRLAARMFGRLPLCTLPADEAVAMGAAVQSGLVAGDTALGDLVVTDITPFTLGTAVTSRYSGAEVADVFSPIIDRGTVIPCSRVQRYSTVRDRQTEIAFLVCQGEHPQASKNTLLGHVEVKGLPKRSAGEVLIDVRFTYDLNGLLEVDAEVVGTTNSVSTLFHGSAVKLSTAEIERARQEMQRFKFHPRDALPNTTALARAMALYAELTGPARSELGEGIAAFRAVLDAQDPSQVQAVREALVALTHRLAT
ncbi:Hsp70 family protein [Nannocystis bainbridge]|uniref:Hsp70 family protein n=1 Tax=Nannocystis bainbridge TaxID=2995303 RepID=A0ABT5DV53_9BACT|nr:Hsp70 family protein [Nannocystis bainbridge]MDC0717484.1 Hsp70 family protein [Nannocystis bainbridge]